MTQPGFKFILTTPPSPGAVAIIQLIGPGCVEALRQLTGRADWPPGIVHLVRFAGIDEGLAVVLRGGEQPITQLMPHGGPRVVQKLIDALNDRGGRYDHAPCPRAMYPEAANDLEADMLDTIARAASPAAIDLLAAQPRLWAQWFAHPSAPSGQEPRDILERSRLLDRLIHPPAVVVMGRPNVGKSTLANRLAGRAASLVADLPGTTRDWVGAMIILRDVAVQWIDTPGLRDSDDAIEQAAINLSRDVIERADVLVALRDPQTPFPDTSGTDREPDLWVMNKVDEATSQPIVNSTSPTKPLPISAKHGHHLDLLEDAILKALNLHDLPADTLWAFSPALRNALTSSDASDLSRYLVAE